MDYARIELAARDLLTSVYRSEQATRPGVLHPMQMLEPDVLGAHLGYSVEYAVSLGSWKRGNGNFEIAGLLDQQRNIIRLSEQFARQEVRFTGAHEVGHIVLRHPGMVIHRDRPVQGVFPDGPRDPYEKEADYFAACVLVPRRLLLDEYAKRFSFGPPLHLDDTIAFNLCGDSAHKVMRDGPGAFACAVARARSFNGRQFRSLADVFNVSVSAMSIRLRELGLVED